MNEYFNEKMSSRDFNKQLMNVMFLGRSNDYTSLSTPPGHGMSSTPLNEAIVCAYDMIADFKKETGKEKINAIFLTDGGADGNSEWHSAEEACDKSMFGYKSKEYMVIRDPVTKRLLHGIERRSGLTASLLTGLAKRHGINVIGFHISPPTKKRENSTESSRLVSFLNGCQVVLMVELLGLLGHLLLTT